MVVIVRLCVVAVLRRSGVLFPGAWCGAGRREQLTSIGRRYAGQDRRARGTKQTSGEPEQPTDEQNNELANQNKELINQMTAIRSLLAGQNATAPATVSNPAELTAKKPEVHTETINKDDQVLAVEEKQGLAPPEPAAEVKPVVVSEKAEEKKPPMWGDYSPGMGISVAEHTKRRYAHQLFDIRALPEST